MTHEDRAVDILRFRKRFEQKGQLSVVVFTGCVHGGLVGSANTEEECTVDHTLLEIDIRFRLTQCLNDPWPVAVAVHGQHAGVQPCDTVDHFSCI